MPKTVKDRVALKLSPSKVRVSPMFHAILACLLGQEGWTDPQLAAVTVTSDGFLLGMRQGDFGFNDFLGAKSDLDRNLNDVADFIRLTKKEKEYLLSLSPVFKL